MISDASRSFPCPTPGPGTARGEHEANKVTAARPNKKVCIFATKCKAATSQSAYSHSAELILPDLIDIVGGREFLNQFFLTEIVGFHKILERVAMIPQFGIDQPQQQVGIHLEVV
jgi:hypothetical protein